MIGQIRRERMKNSRKDCNTNTSAFHETSSDFSRLFDLFSVYLFWGVDLHSSKSFKLIILILDIAVTTSGEIESRTLDIHFLWK